MRAEPVLRQLTEELSTVVTKAGAETTGIGCAARRHSDSRRQSLASIQCADVDQRFGAGGRPTAAPSEIAIDTA